MILGCVAFGCFGIIGAIAEKICPFRGELRQRNATVSVIDNCFFKPI
jgi:hypothetical protein